MYVYMPIAKSTQPYLGCEHVFDTIDGTMKSDAPDQVDKEDHIGKCGCEVHHLQMEPNSMLRSNMGVNSLCGNGLLDNFFIQSYPQISNLVWTKEKHLHDTPFFKLAFSVSRLGVQGS